jgi:hypothetical protein
MPFDLENNTARNQHEAASKENFVYFLKDGGDRFLQNLFAF